MNNLEQLHLEAILSEVYVASSHGRLSIADTDKTASKSAEITEQIAIEFAKFCLNKAKDLDTHTVFCTIGSKSFALLRQNLANSIAICSVISAELLS